MRRALFILAVAVGVACADSPGDGGAGGTAPNAPVSAPVTREDIAIYRRGLAGEIDAMRRAITAPGFTRPASAAPGAAKTPFAAGLDSAGARAAGVDVSRYLDTMRRVSAVLRALSTTTVVAAVIDTAALPEKDRPAARAQLRDIERRAFQGVHPASAEVVRHEAASLDSLRTRFAAYGMRLGRP